MTIKTVQIKPFSSNFIENYF